MQVESGDVGKTESLTVLSGDEAWCTVLDYPLQLNAVLVKRSVYLTMLPVTIAPLKSPGFKVAATGEEQVGGQPAVVLKVTCPDGNDVRISFDKASGLPVKAVGNVFTLEDGEVTQQTTYGNYKDFAGIKVATSLEVKIAGIDNQKAEITEFTVLENVEPRAFSLPREYTDELERHASTVPGPETDKIVTAATGYALFAFGDIVAVQLPTLAKTIVRPPTPVNRGDMTTIHALSGPDAEGRIAYIEDHFSVADQETRRHLLKTIRLDGTRDTELFARPGSALLATGSMGEGEIGHDLALSPVGGRVAFLSGLASALSGLASAQMPSGRLYAGTAEIWDVANKARIKTSFEALDEGLAWFPDGKRIAYVKLVAPKLPAASGQLTGSFGKAFQKWDQVPAVFIRDVDAETDSFLQIGMHPVVSVDGQSVLVGDIENAWKCVNVATGRAAAATWPGSCTPIAIPIKGVVLSICLPTNGAKVQFTEHDGLVVGPKAHAKPEAGEAECKRLPDGCVKRRLEHACELRTAQTKEMRDGSHAEPRREPVHRAEAGGHHVEKDRDPRNSRRHRSASVGSRRYLRPTLRFPAS